MFGCVFFGKKEYTITQSQIIHWVKFSWLKYRIQDTLLCPWKPNGWRRLKSSTQAQQRRGIYYKRSVKALFFCTITRGKKWNAFPFFFFSEPSFKGESKAVLFFGNRLSLCHQRNTFLGSNILIEIGFCAAEYGDDDSTRTTPSTTFCGNNTSLNWQLLDLGNDGFDGEKKSIKQNDSECAGAQLSKSKRDWRL